MRKTKQYSFKAEIYKIGINYCVDVPEKISSQMTATKGYIKIKGRINSFPFTKSLVPVKNGNYRLFVNIPTLKGANASVGDIADFIIEQDFEIIIKEYPMPESLTKQLKSKELFENFNHLTTARKKNILKYMSFIKTEETMQRNIDKLIVQLENKETNPRVP
jgi:hypothetical protein